MELPAGVPRTIAAQKVPRKLPPASRPPRAVAFRMVVQTPIDYPAAAAVELQDQAKWCEKRLLEVLRYPPRDRLRTSPLVVRGEGADVMAGPSRGEKPGERLLRSRRSHVGEHLKKVLELGPEIEGEAGGASGGD